MPTPAELEAIVAQMGFRMTPDEVESYGLVLSDFLEGAEALDAQPTLPSIKISGPKPLVAG